MQHKLLVRTTLLFILTMCFTLALQESSDNLKRNQENASTNSNDNLRLRRAVKKPGFLKTLFSVIFEQWNDTKNTFGTVNKMINDNFLPENAPIEATTPSGPNESTTPYRITRSEFTKIVRRNLRGLRRLFDIEMEQALKQSKKNYAVFRKNASLEAAKFL